MDRWTVTTPDGELNIADVFRLSPLHELLDCAIEPSAPGVQLVAEVGDKFSRLKGMPVLHGGAISTLLDSATTYALIAATGKPWATVDLRVDFLRPAAIGTITVRGIVVKAGRTTGRATAELVDKSGKVCATAIATCLTETP